MSNIIKAHRVSVDPSSGAMRWRIAKRDVPKLTAWAGFDLARVRGSRGIRKDGTLHFTTGGGYAIFDADLLGGNGDGTTERRFQDETGFIVQYRQ